MSAQAEPERKYDVISTVEYEATESTPLRDVRDELGRRAKEAGGDAAVAVRLARSSGDTYVFAADVVRYHDVAKATPTPVPLLTDRELGEIVVPYERQ
jgi:hypothetical protein